MITTRKIPYNVEWILCPVCGGKKAGAGIEIVCPVCHCKGRCLLRLGVNDCFVPDCAGSYQHQYEYRGLWLGAGNSTAFIHLCRGAVPKHRKELSKVLCSGVSGGSGYRIGVHYLFRLCVLSVGSQPGCGGSHHDVDYIGELIFNMLVLMGAMKMADRVVREMMGL